MEEHHKRTGSLTRRRGFTLTEVAAVIASVGVITAVLMPTLAKARREAESAVCRANLKEVGTLINFYSADNNGRMVPNSQVERRWHYNLFSYYVANSKAKGMDSYAHDVSTFYCPMEWRKYSKWRMQHPEHYSE